MQAQSAISLMNMIAYNNGKCAHQIVYLQRYRLTFSQYGTLTESIQWLIDSPTTGLTSYPDIIIMNVGSWITDLGDMFVIRNQLLHQIPMLRRHAFEKYNKNVTLVWRSATSGEPSVLCLIHPLFLYDGVFQVIINAKAIQKHHFSILSPQIIDRLIFTPGV